VNVTPPVSLRSTALAAIAAAALPAVAGCASPDTLTAGEARERCADALVANTGAEFRALRPQLQDVVYDADAAVWRCTFGTQRGSPIRVVLHGATGRVEVVRG